MKVDSRSRVGARDGRAAILWIPDRIVNNLVANTTSRGSRRML